MAPQSLKILTVFGTRPEAIKLFPVIRNLETEGLFNSMVVSTSQHRQMVDDLLSVLSIKVDHDLNIMQDNQSLLDICNRAISGLDPLLKQHRPDLLLVQGDTTTAFIAALAAFYHKIPVGHVEAGLRSFNKEHPYPEEVNRRLISVVSNVHFSPTEKNAVNLMDEGIDTGDIIAQKKLFFSPDETLRSTYEMLTRTIEKLFIQIWPDFVSGNIVTLPQQKKTGNFHYSRDKKKFEYLLTNGWDTPIANLIGKAL